LGNADVPIQVTRPVGVTFSNMDVGGTFACALDQNGAAWCWGAGYNGCMGNGTWDDNLEPGPVSMPSGVAFTDISCGRVHVCAVDQVGNAWCWGSNNDGELGLNWTGTPVLSPSAVQMPVGRTFTTISAGQRFTCALDDLSRAWCWGGHNLAHIACALGDGVCDGVNEPAEVLMSTAGTFVSIGTAYNFVCAVSGTGRLWCWGVGFEGQLAHTCSSCHCEAFPGNGPTNLASVSATDDHACAVDANGLLWCWGAGGNGRLGNGSSQDQAIPQPVAEP
jgi:alpha-tubulin suppressor-like RCC1 family protein